MELRAYRTCVTGFSSIAIRAFLLYLPTLLPLLQCLRVSPLPPGFRSFTITHAVEPTLTLLYPSSRAKRLFFTHPVLQSVCPTL